MTTCRYCDSALRSDAARCDYCGAPSPVQPCERRQFLTVNEWRAERELPPLPFVGATVLRMHFL